MDEPQNHYAGLIATLKDGAVSQLNAQKDRTTDGLSSVATAVRHGGEKLRADKHEDIARYVDEAASQLERVSRHLETKDTGELLSDAQRFARRRPAIFIGSAFAAGLVAARFFKSSADNGHSEDWRQPPRPRGAIGSPQFEGKPLGTAGSRGGSPTSISSTREPASARSPRVEPRYDSPVPLPPGTTQFDREGS